MNRPWQNKPFPGRGQPYRGGRGRGWNKYYGRPPLLDTPNMVHNNKFRFVNPNFYEGQMPHQYNYPPPPLHHNVPQHGPSLPWVPRPRFNYDHKYQNHHYMQPPPQNHHHPPPPINPPVVTRPQSPLPGSEEYIQREINEKSANLKLHLALEVPETDCLKNSNQNVSEDTLTTNLSDNMYKSDNIANKSNKSCRISHQNTLNTKNEVIRKQHKPPQQQKSQNTLSVNQIRSKIINHISNMSFGKKINLVNQMTSTSYDVAAEQINRLKRLKLSKALRDMCNKKDQSDTEIINSIIPDFDIKIDELPKELVEQLSTTLNENLTNTTQDNTVDPELLFQQAADMLNTSMEDGNYDFTQSFLSNLPDNANISKEYDKDDYSNSNILKGVNFDNPHEYYLNQEENLLIPSVNEQNATLFDEFIETKPMLNFEETSNFPNPWLNPSPPPSVKDEKENILSDITELPQLPTQESPETFVDPSWELPTIESNVNFMNEPCPDEESSKILESFSEKEKESENKVNEILELNLSSVGDESCEKTNLNQVEKDFTHRDENLISNSIMENLHRDETQIPKVHIHNFQVVKKITKRVLQDESSILDKKNVTPNAEKVCWDEDSILKKQVVKTITEKVRQGDDTNLDKQTVKNITGKVCQDENLILSKNPVSNITEETNHNEVLELDINFTSDDLLDEEEKENHITEPVITEKSVSSNLVISPVKSSFEEELDSSKNLESSSSENNEKQSPEREYKKGREKIEFTLKKMQKRKSRSPIYREERHSNRRKLKYVVEKKDRRAPEERLRSRDFENDRRMFKERWPRDSARHLSKRHYRDELHSHRVEYVDENVYIHNKHKNSYQHKKSNHFHSHDEYNRKYSDIKDYKKPDKQNTETTKERFKKKASLHSHSSSEDKRKRDSKSLSDRIQVMLKHSSKSSRESKRLEDHLLRSETEEETDTDEEAYTPEVRNESFERNIEQEVSTETKKTFVFEDMVIKKEQLDVISDESSDFIIDENESFDLEKERRISFESSVRLQEIFLEQERRDALECTYKENQRLLEKKKLEEKELLAVEKEKTPMIEKTINFPCTSQILDDLSTQIQQKMQELNKPIKTTIKEHIKQPPPKVWRSPGEKKFMMELFPPKLDRTIVVAKTQIKNKQFPPKLICDFDRKIEDTNLMEQTINNGHTSRPIQETNSTDIVAQLEDCLNNMSKNLSGPEILNSSEVSSTSDTLKLIENAQLTRASKTFENENVKNISEELQEEEKHETLRLNKKKNQTSSTQTRVKQQKCASVQVVSSAITTVSTEVQTILEGRNDIFASTGSTCIGGLDDELLKLTNKKKVVQKMREIDKEIERLTKLRQSLYNCITSDNDSEDDSFMCTDFNKNDSGLKRKKSQRKSPNKKVCRRNSSPRKKSAVSDKEKTPEPVSKHKSSRKDSKRSDSSLSHKSSASGSRDRGTSAESHASIVVETRQNVQAETDKSAATKSHKDGPVDTSRNILGSPSKTHKSVSDKVHKNVAQTQKSDSFEIETNQNIENPKNILRAQSDKSEVTENCKSILTDGRKSVPSEDAKRDNLSEREKKSHRKATENRFTSASSHKSEKHESEAVFIGKVTHEKEKRPGSGLSHKGKVTEYCEKLEKKFDVDGSSKSRRSNKSAYVEKHKKTSSKDKNEKKYSSNSRNKNVDFEKEEFKMYCSEDDKNFSANGKIGVSQECDIGASTVASSMPFISRHDEKTDCKESCKSVGSTSDICDSENCRENISEENIKDVVSGHTVLEERNPCDEDNQIVDQNTIPYVTESCETNVSMEYKPEIVSTGNLSKVTMAQKGEFIIEALENILCAFGDDIGASTVDSTSVNCGNEAAEDKSNLYSYKIELNCQDNFDKGPVTVNDSNETKSCVVFSENSCIKEHESVLSTDEVCLNVVEDSIKHKLKSNKTERAKKIKSVEEKRPYIRKRRGKTQEDADTTVTAPPDYQNNQILENFANQNEKNTIEEKVTISSLDAVIESVVNASYFANDSSMINQANAYLEKQVSMPKSKKLRSKKAVVQNAKTLDPVIDESPSIETLQSLPEAFLSSTEEDLHKTDFGKRLSKRKKIDASQNLPRKFRAATRRNSNKSNTTEVIGKVNMFPVVSLPRCSQLETKLKEETSSSVSEEFLPIQVDQIKQEKLSPKKNLNVDEVEVQGVASLCPLVDESYEINFSGFTGAILVIKVICNTAIAASDKGKLFWFDLFTGELTSIHNITHSPITSIIIVNRQHENILYIGSLDASINIMSFESNAVIKKALVDEPIQCMELAWNSIFIGSDRGSLITYDLRTEKVKDDIKISDSNVLMIKATQEGPRRVLVIATRSAPVSIRDARTGLLLRTMETPFLPTVYTLLFDKNLIYCGTSQHDILVYTFEDGQLIFKHEATKSKGVVCMQIVGNLLFAGCYNGNIYIYNTKTNVYLGTMSGPGGLMLSMEIIQDKIIVGTKSSNFKAWRIPQKYLDQI